MAAWIDELAEALGEEPLSPAETAELLQAAREVAHRVERRITPLAAFLVGSAVGRGLGTGETRAQALGRAREVLRAMLPGGEEGGDADRG
ncbi:MAG TPA: DUF6457 domain-containing protein [Actinomycetota bacterium]|nr:DUF6457 domain-containing protein [Actinomycetota bacterium]